MANKKSSEDRRSAAGFWILIAILVALFLYLISVFQVVDANEKLTGHLNDKKKALDDVFARIVYYRKLKIEIVRTKQKATIFMRCFLATVILIANGLYIWSCYPESITIQHIFECIATFNAALFFLTGILVFAVYGNFLEVKTAYHSIQTSVLEFMFKKNEETIESVLRLDLENREAIKKEILETEKAIKENKMSLNIQEESAIIIVQQN